MQGRKRDNKAIVLLSGGLDSATVLFWAKAQQYQPHCLIFDYGQRHRKEIRWAQRLAEQEECPVQVVPLKFPWQGSTLLTKAMPLPAHQDIDPQEIPSTYVPARNIIFLSFAASYAEVIGARHLCMGANAIDYSGYPDCRPDFFKAYQEVLKQGLKTGVQGHALKIHTPLLQKTKAQIIKMGQRLGVPYEQTWSCYQGGRRPCGRCDSCQLRRKGFEALGQDDPLGNGHG